MAQDEEEDDDDAYTMFTLTSSSGDPIKLEVMINATPVEMELDTGAAVSVLSHATYQSLLQQSLIPPVQKSQVKLKTYTGDPIQVLGKTSITVSYADHSIDVWVPVVDGAGPNLLGRDWMGRFEVTLNSLQMDALDNILSRHEKVFQEDLGCMQGPEIKLHVDEKVKPKFLRPRTVPFMLREKVETELSRLEKDGIISPVQYSRWAAPIVPVVKKNGTVRICGDYKTTINQALLAESYPLPRVEELFADLAGGKTFSKLDLLQAYLQLPLDNESREYVTITTHKGLFRCRLVSHRHPPFFRGAWKPYCVD